MKTCYAHLIMSKAVILFVSMFSLPFVKLSVDDVSAWHGYIDNSSSNLQIVGQEDIEKIIYLFIKIFVTSIFVAFEVTGRETLIIETDLITLFQDKNYSNLRKNCRILSKLLLFFVCPSELLTIHSNCGRKLGVENMYILNIFLYCNWGIQQQKFAT